MDASNATSSLPAIVEAHMTRKLCEASKAGDMKGVKSALRNGAPINGHGPMEKHTALMFATLDGRLEIVKLLLGRKADVNHRNKYGDTALIWAATNGYLKVVKELITAKANVDVQNKLNVTALMEAANGGFKGIVKELLKCRAKLHKTAYGEVAALAYAHKGNQTEIAEILEKEPKRRIKMGGKLLKAIKAKQPNRALGALKLGAPANILGGEEKHSALMFAVLHGSLPIVKSLLQFGAKVNHQNKYGECPLIWASSHGHLDIVRELVKYKPNMDAENKYNITALIEAANAGHAEIVRVLLKAGASLGDPMAGRTAAHYAAKKGNNDIVEIFENEPARRAHREKCIRFGVVLYRALMQDSKTAMPISPLHLGVRRFFKRNPSLRSNVARCIIQMHPALHENFQFIPRPLPIGVLSSISPESEQYKRRQRKEQKRKERAAAKMAASAPDLSPPVDQPELRRSRSDGSSSRRSSSRRSHSDGEKRRKRKKKHRKKSRSDA